jgi:hypothetical protein
MVNRTLVIVIILSGLAAFGLFVMINVLVPRFQSEAPGAGICFHKPQDVVDHLIEPKIFEVTAPKS